MRRALAGYRGWQPFQAGDGLENKWHSIFRGGLITEREGEEQRERANNIVWLHFASEFVYVRWSNFSYLTTQQGRSPQVKMLNTLWRLACKYRCARNDKKFQSVDVRISVSDRGSPPGLEASTYGEIEDVFSSKMFDASLIVFPELNPHLCPHMLSALVC